MSSSRRYQPVSQTADSSDDEDVTLFDAAASKFGSAAGSYDRERALDLPKVWVKPHKHARSVHPSLALICTFVAVLAVALSLALAVAFLTKGWSHAPQPSSSVLPSPSPGTDATSSHTSSPGAPPTQSKPPPKHPETPPTVSEPHSTPSMPHSGSISWEREFVPASTEATLELADMNGDGVLDVVALDGFSLCVGRVVALDGRNGATVWSREVHFPAFAIRCELDLDRDGATDCLVSGRISGFVALSGVDGHTLWARDPSTTFMRYNFYFPLFLPDLDGDGTPDLANTHGGDSTYEDLETDRSPGRLVVVSGRTGGKLMQPLPMPDGGETYMSPVLFTFPNGKEVVLFGSGGETIAGSLWVLSMDSLRERVAAYVRTPEYSDYKPLTQFKNHPCLGDMSDKDIEAGRPTFDPEAYEWSRNASGSVGAEPPEGCGLLGGHMPIGNKYNVCLWELVRGEREGVILPPVLVDMTGDGQDDIVVTIFDGITLVLDGRDGSTVWERRVQGAESYRWVFSPLTLTSSLPHTPTPPHTCSSQLLAATLLAPSLSAIYIYT